MGRNAIKEKGGSVHYSISEVLRIQQTREFDIFLSHSHLDDELVAGVKSVLEFRGYSVFIDWVHNSNYNKEKDLTSTELREVANYLREYMKRCKWMYYLHTNASSLSRWCPWELGYFDSRSDLYNDVYVVPVVKNKDTFKGQEYLSLYPVIEFKDFGLTHPSFLTESGSEFSGMMWRYLDSPNGPSGIFPLSETRKRV